MKNRWSYALGRQSKLAGLAGLPLLLAVLAAPALADPPDWLRAAAQTPAGKYPEETKAVLLYDEQITTIKDDGEITTVYREAYRILRPEGRDRGQVVVPFDNETKLTSLKGWCLPAQGKEYEVKEKDAVETSLFNDSFFSDDRQKLLIIPAADPGNVIGYEYEQKQRPYVLEDRWIFQGTDPVHLSRFTLHLPKGWEYKAYWANHPEVAPQAAGENAWTWEVRDLPALQPEYAMPPLRSLVGQFHIIYYPRSAELAGKSLASWAEVGRWYARLAAGRRDASPDEKQKVQALTASLATPLEKMEVLAAYLQRQVRYVDVEVGIGGWQPHAAADVFHNSYGDCKDKATLLGSMLDVIGVNSYYLILNDFHGGVEAGVPVARGFDHVILAIQVPPGVPSETLHATVKHPKLGTLLIFDPTNERVPLGLIPEYEEGNSALLVGPEGGELIELPLLPPALNRLTRTAKFTLSPDGRLAGQVDETFSGPIASHYRAAFLRSNVADRRKVIENYLGGFLSGFSLQEPTVENLEKYDQDLIIHYQFVSEHYAKPAGGLLLLRPRVLGQKADDFFEGKERKYPVQFEAPTLQTDDFLIALPPGFTVDDLPTAADLDAGFASYKSQIQVQGSVLHYSRQYQIKDILVPTERLPKLKTFYRQVAGDENASAVLKRAE